MTNALTTIPLDSMGDKCLQAYIMTQITDWPVKLSKNEKDALYTAMWNSVVAMKLKTMSQEERDKFYEKKRLNDQVRQEVKQQVKERKNRLKTHHVYV